MKTTEHMTAWKKHGISLAAGTVYGLGVCLISRRMIRNMDRIVPFLDLEKKTADHITQVLGQLRHSVIGSPWLLLLMACGLLNWLIFRIPNSKGRTWTASVLALVLLIPLLLGAVWVTRVNGIVLGKLIPSVLLWF